MTPDPRGAVYALFVGIFFFGKHGSATGNREIQTETQTRQFDRE
jgi:hypothetical protein